MATNGTNGAPEPQPNPPRNQQAAGGGGRIFNIPTKVFIPACVGVAVLVLAAVLVGVLFLTGVFNGGGGGRSAAGPGDVLGFVPADAGFVGIVRVQELTGDDIPEEFKEQDEDEFDEYPFDDFGIEYDDITVSAGVADESLEDTLTILKGDFDFAVIREEAEDGLDCEEDTFRGFELWQCPGRDVLPAVALFEDDGYVVFANYRQSDLEQVLTYRSRTPEELADAEGAKLGLALEKAGSGFGSAAAAEVICPLERCEGFGVSLRKRDEDSMNVVFAFQFSSERFANAAAAGTEVDDFVVGLAAEALSLDLEIEDVSPDGEFVIITGTGEYADAESSSRTSRSSSGSSTREEARASPTAAATEAPAAGAMPTLDPFAGVQEPTPTFAVATAAPPTPPPTPVPIATAVPPTATPPPEATIRPTNTPVPTPTATPTPTPPPTNTPTPAPTPTATPVPITWQDGCREDSIYTAQQCQCIYDYMVERLGRSEVPLYDSDRWVQEERLYTTEDAAYGYCGRR